MKKITCKLSIVICLMTFLGLSKLTYAEPSQEFGLHCAKTTSAISDLNIHNVRFAGVTWDSLEPTEGNYSFNSLDKTVKNISSGEVYLIVTLRPISSWGGNEDAMALVVPGEPTTAYSGFPSDMEAWKELVKRVVERYDGDGYDDMSDLKNPVKFWQIEAEWLWQWIDTKENLVEFLSQTSAVVRETDPSAKIISPAFTALDYLALEDGLIPEGYVERGDYTDSPLLITAEMLAANPTYAETREKVEYLLDNGRSYFDIIDFHTYSRDASIIAAEAEWIKDAIVGMGYDMPIWTLENGGPFYGYTEKKHAEEVIKRNVISLASGIERVFWSSLDPTTGFSENYLRLSLISETGEIKPAYYTYKLMVSKLENCALRCQLATAANIHLYQFTDTTTGAPLYIAWGDEEGIPIKLRIKARWLIVTHIITEPGQTEPAEERIVVNGNGGRSTLYLGVTPVFFTVQ